MKLEQLEVYSTATNAAVVRVPERRFPGIVVQGDSLHGLTSLAVDVLRRAKASTDGELVEIAQDLFQRLSSLEKHYEEVLLLHDIPLPYGRRAD
jgi:hypothetical protein